MNTTTCKSVILTSLVFFLFISKATCASKSAGVILRNHNLEVVVDAENGSVVGIKDKRLSMQYIKDARFARLFRFLLPTPQFEGQHVDSWTQRVSRIEQPNGVSATVHYDSFLMGQKSLAVQTTVKFELKDDGLILRMTIKNQGENELTDVIFPWIGGLKQISNPTTDGIYMPGQVERRIVNPLRTLAGNHFSWNRMRLKRYYRYPQHLASTWVDYSSQDRGLGMEVRDKSFEPLDLYIEGLVEKDREDSTRNRDSLSLAWSFHPHLAAHEEWESPEVIIRPHLGDWHVVADDHRRWVETWIVKPDVPLDFARSLGWHFYFMKHQDGWVVNTYDDLVKMAKGTLAAGIPYMMVFGWQKVGHDNYYPFGYFPNPDWGGEARLKEKLQEVRALGVEPIPFFNATLLDVQTEEYQKFAHDWPVMSRTGGYYFGGDWSRSNFDVPIATAAWGSASSRSMLLVDLCPFEGSTPWIIDTVKRIVTEYGFGNLQLDQLGHKWYCCYNPKHRHAKPQKAYPQALPAVLAEIRKTVRANNPKGVMVGEGVNEFTAQYCDSHWTWSQLDFPEPLLFSLPWTTYSQEIDSLEYGDVNRAFAYKMRLD